MGDKKITVAEFGSSEIAQILGIGVRRLQQLTKEGIIPKISHGKYEIAAVVNAYLNWRLSEQANAQKEDVDLRKERTLLTRAQRKKAEIELGVLNGEVHKSDDVRRVMTVMLGSFRARCLTIPDRTAPMVLAAKDVDDAKLILKKEIHTALQELSEYDPEAFSQPPDEEAEGDE